jgi:hypothetical protein
MKTLFVLCALLLITPSAHAYLDPGSGSAILQGVLGALAAIALTLKLYWHRLLRFFGLRKPTESEESEDSRSAAQSDSDNA